MTDNSNDYKPLKDPPKEPLPVVDNDADYTGPHAPKRSFFLHLGFMRYGTPDNLQGAAIVLSLILLVFLVIITMTSLFTGNDVSYGVNWLSHSLMMTIGVAIGRTVPNFPNKPQSTSSTEG